MSESEGDLEVVEDEEVEEEVSGEGEGEGSGQAPYGSLPQPLTDIHTPMPAATISAVMTLSVSLHSRRSMERHLCLGARLTSALWTPAVDGVRALGRCGLQQPSVGAAAQVCASCQKAELSCAAGN